jgi:hypothetical protein
MALLMAVADLIVVEAEDVEEVPVSAIISENGLQILSQPRADQLRKGMCRKAQQSWQGKVENLLLVGDFFC